MAELTFKSAGVSTREIDLSSSSVTGPVGVPAGVIGTADQGPAFVPVTVANFTEFVSTFGPTDGEKFGPLAVNEWLKNAQSCTYVRVLGVGDGKKRNTSTGKVTNAGFIVGAKQVQPNGLVGTNPYANTHGDRGNVHFLGCYMSESAGSTVFSSAGGPQASLAFAKAKLTMADGDNNTNGQFTEGEYVIIVSQDGTKRVYVLSDGSESGAAATGAVCTTSTDMGSANLSSDVAALGTCIAVNNNLNTHGQYLILNELKAAISHANGHNGKITCSSDVANTDGPVSITLTQAIAGVDGNTVITTNISQLTTVNFGGGGAIAVPILRGILMSASGVMPLLSGNFQVTVPGSGPSSAAIGRDKDATLRGGLTGSMILSSQDFVLFLNGHKGLGSDPRIITASMDPNSPAYMSRVLNTDPAMIEQKGHLLYAHYDVHPAMAVPTGSGILTPGATEFHNSEYNDCIFITTGSLSAVNFEGKGQAGGSATVPEYRSWEDRFTSAKSPYVISQDFGGKPYDLFRVESLSDGSGVSTKYKISIEGLAKSNSDVNKFGKFDLVVRDFYDTDNDKVVLESFRGLSLDNESDRYFARVIGDQKTYFDFDQSSDSQKIVVDGDFTNQSRYIRVKVSNTQRAGEVPDNALPLGFRGPSHLVTSGSDLVATLGHGAANFVTVQTGSMKELTELPIPYRDNLALGTGDKKRVSSQLYWGIQTTRKTDPTEPNKPDLFDRSFEGFAKYFPDFALSYQKFSIGNNAGKADTFANGILDSDRFNNNKFTLENVKVTTGSDTYANPREWASASYTRAGGVGTDRDNKTRAFSVDDLGIVGNRTYAKFTFLLQGGFNGTNIFNKDRSNLSDNAAKREMDDSTNQGGKDGCTVASFRKAVDVMGNKSDVEIKLLAIPGMRDEAITDYATDAVENRFDSLYIMDIEEKDVLNNVVTSSAQDISVSDTVTTFKNRALDSSFAAAYFPDVVIQDPNKRTNVRCPPSVAVLGAFSLNDAIGHPWFAPAGFSRGALTSVIQASVDLNRANLDNLYDADINPITDFPGTGVVVWGQKTLLAAASALDRVNVRRLLIDIRRKVRAIANTLLFEPNRESTLEKFSGLVNPILQKIQEKSGLARYKVIIDTTTTTQADIENNTLRGKIFVQPTRTAEFIALDFVVSNAGAEV